MAKLNLPLWLSPPADPDPHRDRLASFIHIAAWVTLLAAIAYGTVGWLSRSEEWARFVVVASVVAVSVAILALLRAGKLVLSASLLVLLAWAIPTASAVLRGVVHAAVIGVYMALIPLAGLSLGRRAAARALLLVIVSLAGLHAGIHYQLFPRPVLQARTVMSFMLELLTLGCSGGMLYYGSRLLYDTLDRARDHELAMERMRASLDEASQERDDAQRAQAGLERQLQQAQKMESIGRFAGGVAHDFNNLLTVIVNNAKLAESGEEAALEEISGAADRASSLVRQLLAFSRQQVLEPTHLDPSELVSDMESMLRRLIGEHIDWQVQIEPGLDGVLADKSQLQQVVMNLVVNAADAMPRGGNLTVRLDAAEGGGDGEVPPGRYVRLTVADTGVGIAASVLPHIFEPFFTNKEIGEGTGLGLSMVHGVVTQSGGFVRAESKLEKGTTMTVWLPSAGPVKRCPSGVRQRRAPAGAGEILLVEDEPSVRRVVCRVLRRAGYDVTMVDTPQDALAWVAERGRAPDLLLSDVVMPDMSGPELYRELEKRGFEPPVIFMSGYAGDVIEQHGGMPTGAAFLQKPFQPQGLTEVVHGFLGGKTDAQPSSSG